MICRGKKTHPNIQIGQFLGGQSRQQMQPNQPPIIDKIIFTGIMGPTGPQGPMGARGIMGAPGPKGEIGPTGPAGSADVISLGNISFSGDLDECGVRDRSGAPNHVLDFVLPMGETGPTGPMGARGLRGERGPQGERGDQGPIGLTGPQGEKGEPGRDGVSEKIAVSATYTTDSTNDAEVVDNFANNTHQLVFRIPRGATGPQGERGPAGQEGPQGPMGDPGPAGPSGLPAINVVAYFTAVAATLQNEPYFNMDLSYPSSQSDITLDISQNSIKLKRGYYVISYGTNVESTGSVGAQIWLEIDSSAKDVTKKEGSSQGKYFLGGEFFYRVEAEEATLDFMVNEDTTVRFSNTYMLIRKI